MDNTSKILLGLGIACLTLGIAAVLFSQAIIEDVLQIERAFGQEPLSLSFVRGGLVCAIAGAVLLAMAVRRNRRHLKK